MGKKKLFMLSSHGAFDENFESKLSDYKLLCFNVAENILRNVGDGDTAYIGYDGDSYKQDEGKAPPICYLFLKVLDHLIKSGKKINVQPIVCQIGSYIQGAIPEYQGNKQHIENLLKKYETPNENNNMSSDEGFVSKMVLQFSDKLNIDNLKNLKETIKLSYKEVGGVGKEEIEKSVPGKEYQIKINYGPSYKPKREDDKSVVTFNNLLSVEGEEKCFDLKDPQIYKKIKILDSSDNNTCKKKYDFDDGRSDCYGGYTEDNEGNKKLVGSTAGWKLYLNKVGVGITPSKLFKEVYYYPVWLNDVKSYAGSITEQIGEAVQRGLFKVRVIQILGFIEKPTSGGSRKLKRFIKKKSKRRTKSKKPLSKSRRLKKGKKRSRRRN